MSERLAPSPTEMASRFDHVSNANDALAAENLFRDTIGGMTPSDASTYILNVRHAQNPDAKGEKLSAATGLTHEDLYFNSPYGTGGSIHLDFMKHNQPESGLHAHTAVDKPSGLSPEKIASDLDSVTDGMTANLAFQELQQAVNGMDVHDTVDFIRRIQNLDIKNRGADLDLVVGDYGQPQISFHSPFGMGIKADIKPADAK